MNKKQRAFYIILAAMLLNMNAVSIDAFADEADAIVFSEPCISQGLEDDENNDPDVKAIMQGDNASSDSESTAPYSYNASNGESSEITQISDHKWSSWTVTKKPTVTQIGYQVRTCSECGKKEITPIRKNSLRLSDSDRFGTSLAIAKQYRQENGNKLFSSVIIVSGMQFPDALSASYLASVKDAPILVTSSGDSVINGVADFIKKNCEKNATVYIVGGNGAVDTKMEKVLSGFNVKRVWGSDRFVTNLETIKEAGGKNNEIIIASGMNYPDALSASAVGKPILLVQGKTLNDQQKKFLQANPNANAVIVGGTGAVSSEIEAQVKKLTKTVERLNGSNRYETSKMVADRFFGKNSASVMLSYGLNFPDGLCGGPLAAKYGAPLLLADNNNTSYAADYVSSVGKDAQSIISGSVTLGGKALISDESIKKIIPDSFVQSAFTIQIQESDMIKTQPKDWNGRSGRDISFSVSTDAKNVKYRWQISYDGRSWKDIDGADKAAYTLRSDIRLNGTMYRCVVTAGCGETCVSETARVFVSSTLSIITQPEDWSGEPDSFAYLYACANRDDVDYNWQYSDDNGSSWKNSYVNTQECKVKLSKEQVGRIYRCVVADSNTGECVVSGNAKLSVCSDMKITEQPGSAIGELGSVQRFVVQSGGDGLKYQWQKSSDGKTKFADITDTDSAKTACLTQTVTPENCGMYYRCIITDKNGKQIITDTVRLNTNETGFVNYGDKTFYIYNDQSVAKGIRKIGNSTFAFSDSGEMLTGLQTINSALYYFDTENGNMISGVVETGYKIYCFGKDGKAVSGWYTDENGDKYYLSAQDKTAVTGQHTIDGKDHFFASDGKMLSGIVRYQDGTYHYLSEGKIPTGFIDQNGAKYYVDNNGIVLTGLQTIGSDTYYFGKDGAMLTGGYLIDGKRYFFDVETGKAKTEPYKRENEKTYNYNGGNGVGTGLSKVGNELHLYNDEGIELYGRQTFDGRYYYFDRQTGAAISGWKEYVTSSGNSYMSYYSPADNAAVTGLQKIGNDYYLFDDNGYRLHGIRSVNGVNCLFDKATGKLQTGWYDNGSYLYYYDGLNGRVQGKKCFRIDGKYYYFADSGASLTGFRTPAESAAMYFDPVDYSLVNGWFSVNGNSYYCDGTKGMKTGSVKLEGNEYYFSPTSYVSMKGARTVDAVPCWFDENTGIRVTGMQFYAPNNNYYMYNENGRTTGFNYYGGVLYNFSQYGIPAKGAYGQSSNPYGFRTYFDTETGEQQLGLITYTASSGNTYTYYYLDTNCVTAASEIELIKQKLERAKTASGWQEVEGLVYYVQNGDFVKGLHKVDGKSYYFSGMTGAQLKGFRRIGSDFYLFSEKDGSMLTGWQTVEGKQMYFDTSTGKMLTGLQTINGKTYCLLQGGGYAVGTVQIGEDTYKFAKDGTGAKATRIPGSKPLSDTITDSFETINGKTYYHSHDGSLLKGVQIIDKKMYLFDDTGAMQTGVIEKDGLIRCYTENGILIGLQEVGGKLYYFDEFGAALRNKVKVINGKTYYFTEDGSAATGFCYIPDYMSTYYFDEDHTAHTGWLELDGKKYYYYPRADWFPSGTPAHGITYVDGKTMYFDYETAEQKTGLIKVGLNRYMYFDTQTGCAVSGLKNVNGSLYLFSDAEDSFGVSLWGLKTIGSDTYYFDEDTQKAVSGFVTVGSNTYYFDADLRMAKGMKVIDNKYYYFHADKGYMVSGVYSVNGSIYCFGTSGSAITGWYTNDNGEKYYFSKDDLTAYTGIHIIDGKKYFFAANGKMQTGLIKDTDGQYHYLVADGKESGFIELNGNTYYVDDNGCVLTGVHTIGDGTYYFSKYGIMLYGPQTINDKRCFFDPVTGKAVTGLVERENGYTYYYDGVNGVKTGLISDNGKLYYLGSSGNLLYGKRQIGDKYYFFDTQTGEAVSGWIEYYTSAGDVYRSYYSPTDHTAFIGLKQIDGAYYYFNSTGLALSGSVKVNGVSMYFDPNTQKLFTGAVSINGKVYYSDGINGLKLDNTKKTPANALSWDTKDGSRCYYGVDGKLLTGLQIIDKKLYMFDENGKLLTGLIKYRGVTRYYTNNGALTGSQTINGDQYYFSPVDGKMIKGLRIISDVKYSFDDNGRNSEGWIVVNGKYRCYIDHDKGMLTGLQKIDGELYWFGTNGIMRTGMQAIADSTGNQKVYYFGEDGAMVHGLVIVNDKLYYLDEKTGERATGWKTINEKTYYFDLSSGAAFKGRKAIDDYNYYFDTDTCERKLGMVRINNLIYNFSDKTSDGLVHGLTEINGDTYYFNETSGAARYGFVNLDDVYYYFSPQIGKAEEGIRWINKTTAYFFEKTGGVKKGLVSYEGKQYYCYPSNGKVSTGLMSIGDKLYCFDDEGAMMRNSTVVVEGVTYSIDNDGYVTVQGNTKLAKLIRSGIEKLGKAYLDETVEQDDSIDPTNAYNCSKFVSKLLSDVEINVRDLANRQHHILSHSGNYDYEYVGSYDEIRPGDIIYLTSLKCAPEGNCEYFEHIHHAMIYLGDGKVIHSAASELAERRGVSVGTFTDSEIWFTYKMIRLNKLSGE
ncbi:MAG: cell wall-binding repeat-containing protein [Ruminococcus sp.]|nr:cell wall-binding repeat-containing protein [Ruminococcus sp.]